MTVGLLVLAVAGSAGRRFVSPGQLSGPHAPFDDDCSRCHAAGAGGPAHWVRNALADPGDSESTRCLSCHALGDSPLLPHGLPHERLLEATATARASGREHRPPAALALARLGPGVPADADGAIACATCHEEHRGREGDIRTLSNEQCQVCHLEAFVSLGDGHPPFLEYPYQRRSFIKFSHATHKLKHFPGRDRPGFACNSCHRPEAGGRHVGLADFEVSCADCHGDDVRGEMLKTGRKGIPFLSLPSLDLEAFEDPDTWPIGDWPKSKRVAPSPFADLLLGDDVFLSAEDRALLAGLNFADLSEATTEEKNAVARYVWAVKALLYDLGRDGHAGLQSRLETVAGRPLQLDEATDLVGQIGRETIRDAQETWLPRLSAELEIHRSVTGETRPAEETPGPIDRFRDELGQLPPVERADRGRVLSDRKKEAWSQAGGWFVLRRSPSLRYRPRGHEDPFFRAWLAFAAAASVDGELLPGDEPTRTAAERIFALLSKKMAPGQCLKCHSVDASPDGGTTEARARVVQWRPFQASRSMHSPTRFDHDPHFELGKENRCLSCHAFGETDVGSAQTAFEAAYAGGDPFAVATDDFAPMDRALCASCHTRQAAGDACISCHAYHLGDFVPAYLADSNGQDFREP